MTNEHWSVEVGVDGETKLCISDNGLSGVDNIADYVDTIRMIARQLLGFIGKESFNDDF
jgi:hypothetical protein